MHAGRTIVVGTNAGLFARIRPHPDSLVLYSTDNDGVRSGPFTIAMNADSLLKVALEGGFWSCESRRQISPPSHTHTHARARDFFFADSAGVAYSVLTDYRVGGLIIDNYKTSLPLKKGLSSSAAICV